MSKNKVIVILGSGPGIGVATGTIFASKGFDVALLSRNAERLDQDVARVKKANTNVQVKAYPVDLGDHNALALVLGKVEEDLGAPEVVYYNAARVAPSKIGSTGPEFLMEDFKVRMISSLLTLLYPHS
jgi:NAD(P)-dependent dehydrogenase (short-subunit alcohol dehydrogenase family)